MAAHAATRRSRTVASHQACLLVGPVLHRHLCAQAVVSLAVPSATPASSRHRISQTRHTCTQLSVVACLAVESMPSQVTILMRMLLISRTRSSFMRRSAVMSPCLIMQAAFSANLLPATPLATHSLTSRCTHDHCHRQIASASRPSAAAANGAVRCEQTTLLHDHMPHGTPRPACHQLSVMLTSPHAAQFACHQQKGVREGRNSAPLTLSHRSLVQPAPDERSALDACQPLSPV